MIAGWWRLQAAFAEMCETSKFIILMNLIAQMSSCLSINDMCVILLDIYPFFQLKTSSVIHQE